MEVCGLAAWEKEGKNNKEGPGAGPTVAWFMDHGLVARTAVSSEPIPFFVPPKHRCGPLRHHALASSGLRQLSAPPMVMYVSLRARGGQKPGFCARRC